MKNETRKRYDLDTDRIYIKITKNIQTMPNCYKEKVTLLCFIFLSTTDPAPNFRNFYY